MFLKYTPFAIGLFYLVILHNFTEHYLKIKNFLDYEDKETVFKNLVLFPFVFNSKNIYINQTWYHIDFRLVLLSSFILFSPFTLLYLLVFYGDVLNITIIVCVLLVKNILYASKINKWITIFSFVFSISILILFRNILYITYTDKKITFLNQSEITKNLTIKYRF